MAPQQDKAQYLRRLRGQLKFNVQANTSSPALSQAAVISADKAERMARIPVIKGRIAQSFRRYKGSVEN